jgi:SPP1 family phage portal protein
VYPNEPTFEQQVSEQIAAETTNTDPKILRDLINTHDTSDMIQGVDYYFNRGDIMKRQRYMWKDQQMVVDETKPNNKIPHGWHKLLVDQKVSYVLGNPVTFTGPDAFVKKINEVLTEDFDDYMVELGLGASNKGKEWLHPYINEDGELDFIVIPAEQGIPIYDTSKQKNLEAFVRYYPVVVNGQPATRAEWWTKNDVTYWISINEGEFTLDDTEPVNPAPHFYYGEKGYGWGEVPFIEFANNQFRVSDLTFYKELIDEYDKRVSDNSNNLEEIQSLIFVLKGYEGQSLSEFMDNLRYYKAISVDADPGAGVDTLNAELPIKSVDSHLNRLEDSIFTFGQGVNVKTDKFGNSPSGIALKFLYSLLDLKADMFERKFRKGLEWVIWFVAEYLSIKGEGTFNYKDIKFTFNKNIMVNELEMAQIAHMSAGIISEETLLANHPWVSDPSEEAKRKKKEQTEKIAQIQDTYSIGGAGTNGAQ